jgi:hypothetical protein
MEQEHDKKRVENCKDSSIIRTELLFEEFREFYSSPCSMNEIEEMEEQIDE